MLMLALAVMVNALLSYQIASRLVLDYSEQTLKTGVQRDAALIARRYYYMSNVTTMLAQSERVLQYMAARQRQQESTPLHPPPFSVDTVRSKEHAGLISWQINLQTFLVDLMRRQGNQQLVLIDALSYEELIRIDGPTSQYDDFYVYHKEELRRYESLDILLRGKSLHYGELSVSPLVLEQEPGGSKGALWATQKYVVPVYLSANEEVTPSALVALSEEKGIFHALTTLRQQQITLNEAIKLALEDNSAWFVRYKLTRQNFQKLLHSLEDQAAIPQEMLAALNDVSDQLFSYHDTALGLLAEEQGHGAIRLLETSAYTDIYDLFFDRLSLLHQKIQQGANRKLVAFIVVSDDVTQLLQKRPWRQSAGLIIANENGEQVFPVDDLSDGKERQVRFANRFPHVWETINEGQFTSEGLQNKAILLKHHDMRYALSRVRYGNNARQFIGLILPAKKKTLSEYMSNYGYRYSIIGLAIIVLTLLLALPGVRRIMRPVYDLTEQTRRFLRGENDIQFSVEGNDEIAQLGKAYTKLIDKLQYHVQKAEDQSSQINELNASLESKVVRRTRELRDSQSYLQALFDAAADAIITIDKGGNIRSVNSAVENIFGWRADEVVGQSINMLMPGHMHQRHDMLLRGFVPNLESRGSNKIRHVEAVRKNGRCFPVMINISELYVDGQLLLLGILRDVTRERRQQQKIERGAVESQALSELLQASFQASSQTLSLKEYLQQSLNLLVEPFQWLGLGKATGIFLADNQGEGECLRLVANTDLPSELLTLCAEVPFGYCLCGRAAKQRLIQFADRIDSRHDTSFDGMEPHGHYNVPIIYQKSVLGVMVLHLPEGHIKKKFEVNFLERVADVLSLGVHRYYREEDLLRAKETAEQAVRAKGDFLATMSHEIRTPMNAVIGFTHRVLTKTQLDKRQRDSLEQVERASRHLMTVLNDVLDFSKIDAGKMTLRKTAFSVRQDVQELYSIFRELAAENENQLTVHFDEKLPAELLGDPVRLRQIISNLLSNAIKFTHQGQIDLFVGGNEWGEHRYQLQIGVKDTGIGIMPDQKKLIFEAFQQIENVSTRSVGGTGLGLAISMRLAHMMSGDIRVESEKDKGSQFYLSVIMEKLG